MTNETITSLDKYQYDGNTVLATQDFSFVEAAKVAGYTDAGTETRWDAIARLNGFDTWVALKSGLIAGERIIVGNASASSGVATPSVPVTNSNVTYSRLEEPLLLAINKATHGWYIGDNSKDNTELIEGAQFTAYGKAVDQNTNTTYFMSKDDFGSADVTGAPAVNFGISTIDLSPIAAPQMPQTAVNDNEVQPPQSDGHEAVNIPVRVVPPDPLKWQQSYVAETAIITYIANGNYIIHDIAGEHEDKVIAKDMKVVVAGQFEKDGVKYYRTATSVASGTWYGVPIDTLHPEGFANEDELDNYLSSIADDGESVRDNLIKSGATVRGKLDKITNIFKLKRK